MRGRNVSRYEQFQTNSRDDRARIATCSLRTMTDRFKENYNIDNHCYTSQCNDYNVSEHFYCYCHQIRRTEQIYKE